ncbi:MAG: kinase-like domain-containing protein [Linnemannia gamsii]|nr:MAG: kinase-like domain-containing protein [Linnemannia gamsii]
MSQKSTAPRRWGAFEFEQDGQKTTLDFNKEDNEGESGVGGYVCGRMVSECDLVLPGGPMVSSRHFLIYKETDIDPIKNKPIERVFLKDLSSNGTFINGVKVGVNRRVQLKNFDQITYLQKDAQQAGGKRPSPADARRDFYSESFKFTFIEGEPEDTLTFEGQYELGPQLGSGNFATVFKATHRKTGVVYAVKEVKKNESFNAKVEASLEREIGILMSIDHPNLLRIRQVFNEERHYYVVTELAPDGELFDQIIDKQKFTESEARHIFRQVLHGVKYLHDRGVVHRDLKPENILVMDKDMMIVKVSDFGLAKMIGDKEFINTVCGTPSYVAPEVILHKQYGKGVDMWSLGVVLYICLCGFPPFSDDLAPPNLRSQVVNSMYTFPSPYWDDVSDEAVDLIQALLAHNTEDRYTVDAALEHVWMTMEDDDATISEQERRTGPSEQVQRLFQRVMTMRADRAAQRGVRTGFSQSQQFSQNIQDLPEEESDNEKLPESPEVNEEDYSLQVERGDTMQSVEMTRGSGIGIFSQEGMIRVGRLDTDSESDCGGIKGMEDEGSSIYHSFQPAMSGIGSTDAVTGNDSDRSFMSAQESMIDNTNSSSKPSSKDALVPSERTGSRAAGAATTVAASDDAVAATAISGNSRDMRSDNDSDGDDAHLSKKARTEA